MRDAARLVVRLGAAELLFRHFLVRHRPQHVRAGHEHVARVLDHDVEVGNRRRVDGAAGAGPHNRRDLRDDARGERVSQEDVGVAAEREHAFLDARAPRVVQPDDRRAHLHRQIHDLDDLGGVGLRQRTAEDGEVLGKGVDRAALDPSRAGDNAVAGNDLLVHAEVEAAVGDEFVDFVEAPGIEEEIDPLTRRELSGVVLPFQPIVAAAAHRRGAPAPRDASAGPFLPEGLRPSDSPTRFRLRAKRYGETSPELEERRRALARRFAGALRSRGLTRCRSFAAHINSCHWRSFAASGLEAI